MALGGTILVSDKQARLKPCLRCEYSLLHIAGAKNCPECGLAVRISLSGNRGLEWSNPRWQRFLAFGCVVMAVGLLCAMLGSLADWVVYGVDEGYFSMDAALSIALGRSSTIAGYLYPIVCGVGLCMLARNERRYPDKYREVRAIVLTGGILIVSLGLFQAFETPVFWRHLPSWGRYVLSWLIYGPWIPLFICLMAGTFAHGVARRGDSPRLLRISQLPAWPMAIGFLVWLLNLDRMIWPLRSLVWDWLLPLCVLIALVPTARVLLRRAREAEANWETDL